MNRYNWILVIITVSIAVAANTFSAKWAEKGFGINLNFWVMMLLSPLVFVTFGIVSSKLGLSSAAALVDSLLTISTVTVGFIMINNIKEIPTRQLIGITLCIIGIIMINLGKK